MFRFLLFSFLLSLTFNVRAQYFDTIEVHYGIGIYQLDNTAKHTLDSIVTHFKDRRVLIYGHADYLGNENPNLMLSEQRAQSVLQYLTGKGFPETQVMQCIGAGQLKSKGSNPKVDGNPESRNTEIFVIKRQPVAQKATQEKKVIEVPVKTLPVAENVTQINYDNLHVGDTIKLENIGFYPGTPFIIPSSYSEVNNLYDILKSHPTLKICLEGHVCCCTYPDGYFPNTPHWILSVARAKEVRAVLIKRGISKDRLEYKGFGRTHPILDFEQTSEEGQVNRRVEIRVLEK